jgi:HD-like signal output (HDOD) protein
LLGKKLEEAAAGLKRVLFVDDEASILAGLRNVLRPLRHEWEMSFALGPQEALAKVAEQNFDVVVSDMRMPGMDGATLLGRIKELQPNAVRMILTGQTEQETVMRSVFIAHMFLCKPCDPNLLKKIVTRACQLSAILNSEELRAAAGNVEMLPAAPRTYMALNEALARPNCSIGDVARIIERDVGLCAKILHLVNSAFFGLPRRISSVEEAVTFIGTRTIKHIALALEAFAAGPGSPALPESRLATLQEHSLLAAQVAKRIEPRDKRKSEESFLAGILHEIGWLVQVDPDSAADASSSVDRALLGAYLLGLWGLPHPITEAVAYHRDPHALPHSEFEVMDAVYLAHHVVAEIVGERTEPQIDLDYLERMGVGEDQIDRLRADARVMTAGLAI